MAYFKVGLSTVSWNFADISGLGELDLDSGQVLFEWRSLEHIDPSGMNDSTSSTDGFSTW